MIVGNSSFIITVIIGILLLIIGISVIVKKDISQFSEGFIKRSDYR
jgi:hypothetical protein